MNPPIKPVVIGYPMHPAHMLEGMVLENGWTVVEKILRKPNATGGYFSVGYLVRNSDGRTGFLKAMDYTAAFKSSNTAAMLQIMTTSYNFEKNVCAKCSNAQLRRIVHAIDQGSVFTAKGNDFSKVEYLVFEMADGDVRSHLDAQQKFDVAFALRTLHNVATALEQLHRSEIAHQDLKPSNVLVFSEVAGSKVGDFGRAWAKDFPAPHDAMDVAGDQGYAPLERLYGEVPSDVNERRYGCDNYHLGSLVCFLFTRVHITAMINNNLAPEHRPYRWGGTYSEVLPYVQAAFAQAVQTFRAAIPEYLRNDLEGIITQLCNPELNKRGDPADANTNRNKSSLERYISKFDLLASKAEIKLMSGG